MRKHLNKLHHHAKHNYHITGILITLFAIFFINKFLKLEYIGIILNSTQSFFFENLILGILIYLMITIVIINTPLAITPALYIMAGYFYGLVPGVTLSVLSITIASYIGFKIVRTNFRKHFNKHYEEKIKHVNQEIQLHGLRYFFTLRTMAIVPHYVINIFGGLSKIPTKTFLKASIGFLPESIVYTYAGTTLTNLKNIESIFTIEIIIAISLIVILGMIPAISKLIKNHRYKNLVIKFDEDPIK